MVNSSVLSSLLLRPCLGSGRLAGLSFNYPNAVADSETGSIRLDRNVIANIAKRNIGSGSGAYFDYIWSNASVRVAYKQCGSGGKTVSKHFH